MRLTLTLSTALLFALACTGGSGSDDSGASEGFSDDFDGTFTDLPDPCQGGATPHAVTFLDAQTGYVGCGNGLGLWRTDDGGASFTPGHPSSDLYVYQVLEDSRGRLLVCGHDYESASADAMLYRLDGETWTTLLSYGNNADDPASVYMSNCGAVAEAGDGRLVVASLTAGDLSWSTDDGGSWVKEERYWSDENLDPDGYAYYYMLSMIGLSDGSLYGAGSQITEPPVVFTPSQHPDGDWFNFHPAVVDDGIIGEVWSLATPDDGQTWLAGGRDQGASSVASGFIYRSTDGGQTWAGVLLPEGVDVVHDIAMDGERGIAVGHRYPTTQGGFILLTADGGQSWTELEADVPILQSADAVDGVWWAAGDGWMGKGGF